MSEFNLATFYRTIKESLIFIKSWFYETLIHILYKDNCSLMAGGISFFAIISFIPLFLLSVSVLGYVLHSSDKAGLSIFKFLTENMPTSTVDTFTILRGVIDKRQVFGLIGILGMIWAGSRIFFSVENSMNIVWRAERKRPYWKSRSLALILVPTSVLIMLISIFLTSIYTTAQRITIPVLNFSLAQSSLTTYVISLFFPLVTGFIFFFVIYKFIPYRKIGNVYAIVGAIFASVMWEITKFIFDFYILNLAQYSKIYGPLAALIITFLWIYLSAFILVIGAEIGWNLEKVSQKPRLSSTHE
jgi:membrane protein